MRPTRLLVLLPALALALGGCGGGHATTVAGRTVRIALDEYRIVPQRVTVSAGRLRFVVHNRGRLLHDLQIAAEDGPGASRPIARTHGLHPGQSATLTVRLAPGRYRLSCTLFHHDELGQYGTLRVTARSSADGSPARLAE